jgi:hypothetical protein
MLDVSHKRMQRLEWPVVERVPFGGSREGRRDSEMMIRVVMRRRRSDKLLKKRIMRTARCFCMDFIEIQALR